MTVELAIGATVVAALVFYIGRMWERMRWNELIEEDKLPRPNRR